MTGHWIRTPDDKRGRSLVLGKSFTSQASRFSAAFSPLLPLLPSPSPPPSPLFPCHLSLTMFLVHYIFLWFLQLLPGVNWTHVLEHVVQSQRYADAVRSALISHTSLDESNLYRMILCLSMLNTIMNLDGFEPGSLAWQSPMLPQSYFDLYVTREKDYILKGPPLPPPLHQQMAPS